MSFRMIQPWENPRSKFYWFPRRVPSAYRKFGLPAEIKFSLETTDWDEAGLRCQEENLILLDAAGDDPDRPIRSRNLRGWTSASQSFQVAKHRLGALIGR